VRPKALIVEDNDNNRYLLTLLLEHAGFEVIAASTGQKGIERARAAAPDIILLDIQMPEMDGYETAANLKSDPGLSFVPIVGVSSFAMPGDRDKALRAGFSAYIEKPVDPDTFGQTIARLTRGQAE
jgi:two-component system, cell cycle response regulator DivK